MSRLMATLIVYFLVLSTLIYLNPSLKATVDYEQFALNFLEKVVGFNNYNLTYFEAKTNRPPYSQHYETYLDTRLATASNARFETMIGITEGKFFSYWIDSQLNQSELNRTFDECLLIAKDAIARYQQVLDAPYCGELTRMISTAVKDQTLSVTNEDALMTISRIQNCSTWYDHKEYVRLEYSKRINYQFTCRHYSLTISVSRSGLITRIDDGIARYHIATTDVNVSEEQAVNLARPYAEQYASDHGQQIAATKTMFLWIPDFDAHRGDDYAIYPVWAVQYNFDETNSDHVFGYSINIWADNSSVFDGGPRGSYVAPVNGDTTLDGLLLIGGSAMIVFSLVLGFLKKRTPCRKGGKKR